MTAFFGAAISMLSVVLSGPVAGASSVTIPPTIPTGATSLTWSYPMPVNSKVTANH